MCVLFPLRSAFIYSNKREKKSFILKEYKFI